LRVVTPLPPSQALQTKPSGLLEKDSPPTVAGAASDLFCRQRTTNRTEFPFCRSTRPAHLNGMIADGRAGFVNSAIAGMQLRRTAARRSGLWYRGRVSCVCRKMIVIESAAKAGEGCSEFQQTRFGEGVSAIESFEEAPSPDRTRGTPGAALSRKGSAPPFQLGKPARARRSAKTS
jgi:hypothetical protein